MTRRSAGPTVLVAVENRFTRASDGCLYSQTGVDGYAFWRRYLEAFAHVLVLARTAAGPMPQSAHTVEGPGVEVVPLPDYRGSADYVRQCGRVWRCTAAATARADALVLRAPGPIAGGAWRMRGRRPAAVEVIGDPLDALNTIPGGAARAARWMLARELRVMCRKAHAVAYVTAAALQARYPARGWSTSYSSIELNDDAFVDETVVRRRATARTATTANLVFVGTLSQLYKGQEVLVDALAMCRAHGLDITLAVVGDGVYRSSLEARAHAKGVAEAIRWHGQVAAGPAVRAVVDGADLFVLPSLTEGLPRAMMEAMARGVPALGTRVGGIPELLPGDRLVPPGNAPALAAAIGRLCAPACDRSALGLRDLVVARGYHARVLAPRRLACYARLAAAADRRGLERLSA